MKIAIVGNSPCLKGKHLGHDIDSHDEVIRFNNYTIDDDCDSFGGKTTIISVVNSCLNFKHKREFLLLDKNHRIFMSAVDVDKQLKGVFGDLLTPNDVTLLDPEKYHFNMRKKMPGYKNNHLPSSGLLAMQYIVDKFPLAQIDAYGFSFFSEDKNGGRIHLYDNCNGLWHDGDMEKKYFETYLKNKINLHI